jgi:thymidylate synthase (FAD)
MHDSSVKIPVLDKGFVQYVAHMGDDLTVVNAARVSFHKESEWDYERDWRGVVLEQSLPDRDRKLIHYLAKHKHWTPFAHPQITLRIKAPISIRTQLFKHKVGFVENEVSRRYVDETPEVYIPNWRTAPVDGAKQGSGGFVEQTDSRRGAVDFLYRDSIEKSMDVYESMIAQGIAPEQARFVLPQGTYTEWWWTGSLAGYARVHGLRSDPHAQWEIREYAAAIDKVIAPLFPESWKALTLP